MKVDYVTFPERAQRYAYLLRKFNPLLHGRVLDVGCDRRQLRDLMAPGTQYTGIDLMGDPDIKINLETIARLPFEDQTFDCVICTDVLEHLERLHHIFGELVRVTRGHLIISLPNCWNNMRKRLILGTGHPRYYGLPTDPPDDRHRWFFNITDVRQFMEQMTRRYPIEIVDFLATEKPRLLPLRLARRMFYPRHERYLNLYAHSSWTVLRKTN